MAIDGITNVVKVLEQLETGSIPEIDFLELRSCDQGCAGGILLSGNRFLTVERLERRARKYPRSHENNPDLPEKSCILEKMKVDPFLPERVFSLDKDLEKAVNKMATVERIVRLLPAIDCGACGAPTCRALAEDIVLERARMTDCIFFRDRSGGVRKNNSPGKAGSLEKKWGKERFVTGITKNREKNEGS
jgi:hypothetical protein